MYSADCVENILFFDTNLQFRVLPAIAFFSDFWYNICVRIHVEEVYL